MSIEMVANVTREKGKPQQLVLKEVDHKKIEKMEAIEQESRANRIELNNSMQEKLDSINQSVFEQIQRRNELGDDIQKTVNEQIQATQEQLDKTNQLISNMALDSKRYLDFQVRDTVRGAIVFVHNYATDEVVRQIPLPEFIKMAEAIKEFQGIFFDKRS
jgi:uncharacterized FlaG/YvyC family protein